MSKVLDITKYEVFSNDEGVGSIVLCVNCINEPKTSVTLLNTGQRVSRTENSEVCERCGR